MRLQEGAARLVITYLKQVGIATVIIGLLGEINFSQYQNILQYHYVYVKSVAITDLSQNPITTVVYMQV